jgi:hypothetical protein
MANPYLIGGLVVAGLGAAWWATKKPPKKKSTSNRFRLFGDDCQLLTTGKTATNAEGQKFINAQIKSFGGYTPLGDPPGDYDLNTEWAQAFATRIFRVNVAPACIKSLGLSGENRFGPNYFDSIEKMPAHLQQHFSMMVLASAGLLAERGYQVVGSVIVEEPPGLEGSANIPVFADLVRGL